MILKDAQRFVHMRVPLRAQIESHVQNERGYFKTLHRVGCFENFSLFLTYNRIGVPYGHDFFLLVQRTSLRGLSRYLEHSH